MTSQELQVKLIAICRQIASGDYEQAKAVFDLTPCDPPDDNVNSLVEAFAMMLLRVEAREFELSRLVTEITDARIAIKQTQQRLMHENRRLRKKLREQRHSPRPVAQSDIMQSVMLQAEHASQQNTSLLITGETGVGKDLFARYIHSLSQRSGKPIIVVNCAAIPANHVNNELFGQDQSSSAASNSKSRFELANGGTILLNEVHKLPLESQAKLVELFDSGELSQGNGKNSLPLDVRIISSTHIDLEEFVTAGTFRADLYYRLTAINLYIPPLRARVEDIPVLAKLVLARIVAQMPMAATTISPAAMEILVRHPWPGNVRELENTLDNAALLAESDSIQARDINLALNSRPRAEGILQSTVISKGEAINDTPECAQECVSPEMDFGAPALMALADIEAIHIKKILNMTAGNKSRAALLLGISREGLRAKLQKIESEKKAVHQ